MKTYLALGNEDGNVVALARSNGEIGHTFDSQLVPDSSEIVALKKLHLVCHTASAELLIRGVLKVPAREGLLDKLSNGLLLDTFSYLLDRTPNLEVLGGITSLILGGAFIGAEIGTPRGEGDLEDINDGDGRKKMTSGGIDNADAVVGRPGEVAATGRVDTATQVPFRLNELSERLVDRRSVGDANGLLGSVGKLQRRRHD